jgi:iron(II)-dependent oxidoreductase
MMRVLMALALVSLFSWPLGCVADAPGVSASAANTNAAQFPKPAAETTRPPEGMIRIPAGAFTFGATEEQFQYFLYHSMVNFPGMKESLRSAFVIPPQRIELPEFYIDEFEVTNRQFREFVVATGYAPTNMTAYLKVWDTATSYPSWAASFPVVWISAEDAAAYCAWRGGRLPTEQEWEKAARGTDGRLFPWGEDYAGADTINLGTNKPEPVGNRPADKSPYGVYDLGGNVAELTSSAGATADGTVVVRGGSFLGAGRDAMAIRRVIIPKAAARSQTIGCRCARSAAK